MSQSVRKQSRKRQRPWLIIGLLIILLSPLLLAMKQRAGWLWVIRASKYAHYLDWIVAMSQHETNGWKSSLFVNNNNLFGMKVPSKRKYYGAGGTPAPDGGNYAKYKTWADSAKDLLSWMDYVSFPPGLLTVDAFVKELRDKRYFTDSVDNYLAGVKRWLKIGYDNKE